MSNVLIGLLAGLSIAVWIYTKIMRRTGGNTKNSLVTAGILGFFAFIIVFTIAITIDNALK
jgi:4-amino-4-deoxy-L-arabinose transferase-like glycosyltransferase